MKFIGSDSIRRGEFGRFWSLGTKMLPRGDTKKADNSSQRSPKRQNPNINLDAALGTVDWQLQWELLRTVENEQSREW